MNPPDQAATRIQQSDDEFLDSFRNRAAGKSFLKNRRIGRPPIITKELTDKIILAVSNGAYIETAAAFAGITKDTLFAWLKRGAREKSGLYKSFSDSLREALAQCEIRDITIIQKAAISGDWKASAWRIERRAPSRWGRRDFVRQEVSGPGGKELAVAPQVVLYLPDNGRYDPKTGAAPKQKPAASAAPGTAPDAKA